MKKPKWTSNFATERPVNAHKEQEEEEKQKKKVYDEIRKSFKKALFVISKR